MNNKSEIIYLLSTWTVNNTWELQENESIKKTVCLELSEFQYYQTLPVKEKMDYLLRNDNFRSE